MDLYLVDLLSQAVEEYNALQTDESKLLDWWEDVVDNINDTEDENEIKQLTADIKREIALLKSNGKA